jgi:hypothetical protein
MWFYPASPAAAASLVAGDVPLQHIRLDVAERRFRLGRDAFGEGRQDAVLEVRPRVQGDDLGPVG